MTDTNLPEFAQAMAAIPKRLRNGIDKAQHGRTNAMLIHSEDDPTVFIGRLTKKARGKYIFEVFEGDHSAETATTAKVVHSARVSSPLRGITLARQYPRPATA